MKSHQFENPQLYVNKASELPLSGPALLELMRAVLAKGKSFRFSARGWSMEPFIRDGDVITVEPIRDDQFGLGDVIAFIRPSDEKLVVHRVIDHHSGIVIFQGDNGLEYPGEGIPQGNMIGKVRKIERNGRNVWFSLGPERFIIAWLSRVRLLTPIYSRLSLLLKPGSQGHK